MASLIEIILGLLNVDLTNRFVQETLRQGPVEATFYLIFFPTIFIIFFIYVLSAWILSRFGGGTGLRLLVSVAIYALIVLEGWYTLVISVSNIWWLVVVALIGFWVFTRAFVTGGGGGRGGAMPGTGKKSLIEAGKELIIKKGKGDFADWIKEFESALKTAESAAKRLQHYKGGEEGLGPAQTAFTERMREVQTIIKKIENEYKLPLPVVGEMNVGKPHTRKLWRRYNELLTLEARIAGKD